MKIFDAKGTQVVSVAKSTLTVGSASHCDIVLDHASLQGEHLRAWLDGGRIWVQDLGTTTGTFLNGTRLPSLKPMLVRELDILKMGECPATLGLEVNMVRAPVVKNQVDLDEITLTEIKPIVPKDPELEKKRQELADVSRELAELKLKLQMGRMDEGAPTAHDSSPALQAELKELRAEKDRLTEALRQIEQEKAAHRKNLENEIAELKLKALRDLKDLKDEDARKFATWKVDMVSELTRNLRDLTLRRGKVWDGRTVSKDLMMEWEAEMNHFFRKLILNDDREHLPVGGPPDPVTSPSLTPPPVRVREVPSLPDEAGASTVTTTARSQQTATVITSAKSRSKDKSSSSRRKRSKRRSSGIMLTAAGAMAMVIAATGLWFIAKSFRKPTRNVASQAVAEVVPAPPAEAPAPARYQPRQSKGYKTSYTDNVLYTQNFLEAELNSRFRTSWLADLSRTALRDWKLQSPTVNTVANRELLFLQDLQKLREAIDPAREREGIKRMRVREDRFERELESLLGSKAMVGRFMRLKRSFHTRHIASVSKPAR